MSIQSLCADDWSEFFIETYSDMVYRIAAAHMGNREDAEDVYQEVFLIYLQKKPEFHDMEHGKAWLIRTTINCCKRSLLSTFRRKNVLTEDAETAAVIAGEQAAFSFELKEENDVYIAMQELPEKYRMVIWLFYFEDLSVQDISTILKRRPGTVRMQLTRGRDMLRETLAGKGG